MAIQQSAKYNRKYNHSKKLRHRRRLRNIHENVVAKAAAAAMANVGDSIRLCGGQWLPCNGLSDYLPFGSISYCTSANVNGGEGAVA